LYTWTCSPARCHYFWRHRELLHDPNFFCDLSRGFDPPGIERRIAHRLKRVSWNVVVFVIALFIVVKSLDVSGVNAMIGEMVFSGLSDNIFVATYFVSLLSAFMCNLVNNIPMTAMMLSIIQQAGLSLI